MKFRHLTAVVCLAATVVVCTVMTRSVRAENPNWPAPPSVTDLSQEQYWPSDPSWPGDWQFFSFIPKQINKSKLRPAELAMGSGLHADRAWQTTTGDPRVVLAVLDSGIRWSERDLVTQFYLNSGELPAPDAACRTAQYDAARPHDANGDGVFNIYDYTTQSGIAEPTTPCDPRISGFAAGWDTNNNKILDPQDLIQIFSDGTDDDNNGYRDDISGWDFFDNDNDPNDDTNFGHGTGQAKDAAAAGNNNVGGIGVCPKCRVLPVRVGDSFVVDVNNWALGAVFAVDSGVTAIQTATGALNNNPLAIAAIEYAYASNVVVIGSAADENALHLNWPAGNQHTVYTHAIVYDSTKVEYATTFLNFNNCTNYGPRLELSTPGRGCSSEATGNTGGIVGLIASAALQANVPFSGGSAGATDTRGTRRLSAEEMRQILIGTVDDIDVPESKTDPTKYPSGPGWEQRFGYGRTNAGNSVAAVLAGKIPPEVDLTTPNWFDVIYPERDGKLKLMGRMTFRKDRYQSMNYVIEWAPGADPKDGEFTTLVEKTGVTDKVEGLLHEWDVSQLKIDNPPMPAPDRVVNRRLVTVRVRVTAKSSTLGEVVGEARRAFHVERDPDLLPGFPVNLGASGESSPKTADIDGDGKREIVLGTSDGLVHVIGADGKELPGWPAKLNRLPGLDPAHPDNARGSYAFAQGKIAPDQYSATGAFTSAIGDLDGDGKQEIVVTSFDGKIYVFAPDASVRPGFPVSVEPLDLDKVTDRYVVIEQGVVAAPVLADLDNDNKLEIVIGALDGKLYVWREDGTVQDGFPVLLQDPSGDAQGRKLQGRIMGSPAIGDMDGDGMLDIVVPTNESLDNFGPLYVVHGDGNKHAGGEPYHPNWPQRLVSTAVLPFVGEGLPNAAALADLNGDGLPEICIAGIGTAPKIIRGNGERQLPLCFDVDDVDLDTPGWEKSVVPCARKITKSCEEEEASDKRVRCVNGAMNNSVYGEKSDSEDAPSVALIAGCSFGDLNNDRITDVVMPMAGFGAVKAFASGGIRSDYDNHVGAWSSRTASYLPGFPRRIDDWQFFLSHLVADVSGDNKPEVIAGSAGYWLHAWDVDGNEAEGWPKLTGQWMASAPAIGDLTGDKKLEVVAHTRSGWLYAWKTRGSVDGRIDWPSVGHDNRNTRNLATPLPMGISAAELPSGGGDGGPGGDGGVGGDGDGGTTTPGDSGCSCSTSGSSGDLLLLLLAAPLVLTRRRRR